MARPFLYKRIDYGKGEYDMYSTLTLGIDIMYGIKHIDQWIVMCSEDSFNDKQRKYYRPFLATKKSAESQCNKLNKLFNTDKYHVVAI